MKRRGVAAIVMTLVLPVLAIAWAAVLIFGWVTA